jgi:hypothetical protein
VKIAIWVTTNAATSAARICDHDISRKLLPTGR